MFECGNFSLLLLLNACMSHPWKMHENIPHFNSKERGPAKKVHPGIFTLWPYLSEMLLLHPYHLWALESHSLAAHHCWDCIWTFSLVPFILVQQAVLFWSFFILPHDGFILNILLFVVLRLICLLSFSCLGVNRTLWRLPVPFNASFPFLFYYWTFWASVDRLPSSELLAPPSRFTLSGVGRRAVILFSLCQSVSA